jgi:hypothetical protein
VEDALQRAQANTEAAISALERELRRRPFDPLLALTHASEAGSRLEIGPLFEVLARPLRHNRPPPAYLGYLREISKLPDFGQAFEPIYKEARAVAPEQPVASWASPWAPETLRLAAIILADRGHYAAAEREVARAATLYGVLRESAPLAAAACHEELAECRFLAEPDDPAAAVQAAQRAITLAPDSQPGRRLARNVRNRMATYELAGGNEAAARDLLSELQPDFAAETIDTELGYRYSNLAHSALRRSPGALPRRFPAWVEHALRLNPEYEMGWEEEELIRLLSAAHQAGADLEAITGFVDQLCAQRPDSAGLRQLRDDLRGVTAQPITTRPTTTRPADPPPAGEAHPAVPPEEMLPASTSSTMPTHG